MSVPTADQRLTRLVTVPAQPPPEPQPLAGPAGQQIDLSQIPIEFEEPSVTAARSEAAGAGGDAVTAGSVITTVAGPVTAAAPAVAQSLVEYVTAQARQSETAPRRKTTITVEQYREMQMKKRPATPNSSLLLSWTRCRRHLRWFARRPPCWPTSCKNCVSRRR